MPDLVGRPVRKTLICSGTDGTELNIQAYLMFQWANESEESASALSSLLGKLNKCSVFQRSRGEGI